MAFSKLALALTAGLSMLALSAAHAQQRPQSITIGQVVRGDLTDRDTKIDGSAPYDQFTLRMKAGEGAIITLDSDAFDPAVEIGQGRGEDFSLVAGNDDGGGGERGLNARLRFKATEAGEYVVRVRTVDEAGRGAYVLALTATPPEAALKVAPLAVARNETTVSGVLAEGGARTADDNAALLDRYTLQLRKDDVVRVRASSEFDNVLRLYRAGKENEEPIAFDDDSGGDGDAQLIVRAPETGAYSLDVTAYSGEADAAGPYTVSTLLLPTPPARARVSGVRKGQTVQGRLEPGDAVVDDSAYRLYDLYELRGRAGETVTIRLNAAEGAFDPVLAIGGLVAGQFAVITENDDEMTEMSEGEPMTDGPPNLNSKLVFTFKDSGVVILRATSLVDGATGDYSISVE